MTDDLIKRLRDLAASEPLTDEAADALEAQAKRIVELEAENATFRRSFVGHVYVKDEEYSLLAQAAKDPTLLLRLKADQVAFLKRAAKAEAERDKIEMDAIAFKAGCDEHVQMLEADLAAAKDRIAELEAEGDGLRAAVSAMFGRAEKAEADLAAARAALRDACESSWVWKRRHAPAIAAARGEKPGGDKCAVCGSDPCGCKQPKSDECPTCEGDKLVSADTDHYGRMQAKKCPDCGGTGKKETK